MEINGRMKCVLPTVEGENDKGQWRRGGFVITCGEETERDVAFQFRKDELFEQVPDIPAGKAVRVSFIAESRTVTKNGEERWFTELRAYRIEQY